MDFGGTTATESGTGRMYLRTTRPQVVTKERSTDGTTWTACAGTIDCWHGTNDRDLGVTLGSSSSYTAASVDALINCKWNGRLKVKYNPKALSNGNFAMWYNRSKVITGNGAAGGFSPYYGTFRKFIAFTENDEFPVFRMELSKASTVTDAWTQRQLMDNVLRSLSEAMIP